MSDDSVEPSRAIERQTYLEHRKSLVELGVAQIGLFDKTLLLLSTGALGSSALFVNTFIGPAGKLNMQPMLAVSWLAFAITMVANLLSYLSSWYDMETERKAWDDKYEKNDLSAPHDNRWRAVTQWLNGIALLSFVFGLVCMLVFCFNNLGGRP
jgi:hypothetical protein